MLFVLELIVKPGADILVHRFQFDENQGKAVDEADQVGPPIVMRNANALDLQLPNGEKAVVSCIAEVDHPGQRVFCLAARFPPFDRDPAPDEPEKLPIVLNNTVSTKNMGTPKSSFHGHCTWVRLVRKWGK